MTRTRVQKAKKTRRRSPETLEDIRKRGTGASELLGRLERLIEEIDAALQEAS